MKITCISDLHGCYPDDLPGGDLLIVAGDLTATDTQNEIDEFDRWLSVQKYRKKVFIAGNHDNRLVEEKPRKYLQKTADKELERFEYLCDSGTEFEGVKIWGSPWSLTFDGINPRCTAFTGTESDLVAKFALIPNDVDILITHMPPNGILDTMLEETAWGDREVHVGSFHLRAILQLVCRPGLWVCGHIHEAYGTYKFDYDDEDPIPPWGTLFVNASHVNERYQPVNAPIHIETA